MVDKKSKNDLNHKIDFCWNDLNQLVPKQKDSGRHLYNSRNNIKQKILAFA